MRVSGRSLHPMLDDGDFVLVCGVPFLIHPIREGDIVVLRHQVHGTLIKQVSRVLPEAGRIHVTGTRHCSLDSRELGDLPLGDVMGKVVCRIAKPAKRA